MRLDMLHPHVRAVCALAAVVLVGGACGLPDITIDDIDLCSDGYVAVSRVRVQPAQANLRVGFTLQVEAKALDAEGQSALCTPPVELVSTNPSVATVSSAGTVTGVSAGKAFIRATSGGKSDSAAVTVVSTALATLTIEAPSSLLVGQTAQLKLVARDTDGNVITPQSFSWQTGDAAVATVSPLGMFVAVNDGIATVTAVAEQLTAVATIPLTRDAPTRRFRQIATGFQHTCAIVGGGGVPDGTAFCWGDGSVGQLGIGQTGYAREPFPVSGGHVFASIAVGNNSSCALTAAGEAYCWGRNDSGQLGDGTIADRNVPVRVNTAQSFQQIALGGSLTCGLTTDGAAHCWGRIGTVTARPPTLVPGGIQFADITAGGGGFVCGRTSAGRAYCWGSAYTWAGATPTATTGDVLFSQISASTYHVCGVAMADGLGYCWGRLDTQPLGSSVPQGTRETPVVVPGALRYANIAPGGGFTCGVTASGSFCLGATLLSNSGPGSSPTPIPAEDRHRFATISGGSFHGCAIDTNGGGWCWGRNYEGQIGAGEYQTPATEPRQLRIR
jgi:alpha-tubulin suppressor-like RCC1 family protein